ncbi:MAG: hypothetical protein U9N49_02735, partial [Campylobacterota bacterium]|nr:hypothetical protein [Campylobacterota bacterium]
MHYLKLKKRYDIRSCPRCARGKMFDMHLHSQKIENGLYVCNHCGHYHKKYSMNNVIIGFVFIMITVSLGDMNHLGIRLVILLFIYIIFRELKKYFLFNSSY